MGVSQCVCGQGWPCPQAFIDISIRLWNNISVFLRLSVQFVRRAGVREVGGYVLMEAGPLDQLHFYWGLLTDLAHPSSPFFCHDCNHTALFKGNLSRGVTYPFVCACVTAWIRANLGESAGTNTHGTNHPKPPPQVESSGELSLWYHTNNKGLWINKEGRSALLNQFWLDQYLGNITPSLTHSGWVSPCAPFIPGRKTLILSNANKFARGSAGLLGHLAVGQQMCKFHRHTQSRLL